MTLTHEQAEFLALHIKRTVLRWNWHFDAMQLRASSAHRTVSLSRHDLEQMISGGLMEQGAGFSVRATAAGREWLQEKEAVPA